MIKSGAIAVIQHRVMTSLRSNCSCIRGCVNGVVEGDGKLVEAELTIFSIDFSQITNS